MVKKKDFIFVTGHSGLVGSSVLRRLNFHGYKNIITIPSKKLDLRNQKKVYDFFKSKKISAVINTAGTVGGIYANNKYRAKFIYDNLLIQTNIIHACYQNKIKNLILLGSSCVYPRDCKQPIKENYLLQGELEHTNEPYAIAKIAGIKMLESYNYQYGTSYKCLMPCNIYGPNDNYNLKTSHFFPALIKKALLIKNKKNKRFILWGTGKPRRELMYVDDLADACIYFLNKKTKETLINVGTNHDKRIIDYAKFVLKKLNMNNQILFDKSKPDGTPRKKIDSTIANKYGWKPIVSLEEGFNKTIKVISSISFKN